MSDTATEPKKERVDRAPRGTSTANERRKAQRKKQIRETLTEAVELADEFRGRSDAPVEDVLDILRRDTERIAETLANLASRFQPAAFAVDHLFGSGGPLSILVSFGPFLRALFRKAREIRMEQQAEYEAHLAELESQGLVEPQAADGFASQPG